MGQISFRDTLSVRFGVGLASDAAYSENSSRESSPCNRNVSSKTRAWDDRELNECLGPRGSEREMHRMIERRIAATKRSLATLLRTFLGAGALLLVYSTFTFAARQDSPPPQSHQLQSSGPLAEAQSSLSHGNAEGAIQILSDYLQTWPNDSRARTMLGQAYASIGQNERAEDEFSKALESAPDDYVALAALGELYEREGLPEKAETFLAHAAHASRGIPEIRTEWGVVLVRLHRYKEAQSALAGLTPPRGRDERVAFHRLKASVAAGLGERATAASEMEMALALIPTDPGLASATAMAELQSGNPKRAANLAEPVFSRTHAPQIGLICLEAELEAHSDFHQTLDSLRASQISSSDELAFRERLAELLISHREYFESIEDLAAATRLDPSRADLQFNLALAEFRAGLKDDALASAEKCQELGDNAELEDLLGDIQEARGDNLAAVKNYQAAVALAPNDEKYRVSLAVELIQHSNLDAARIVLKQAEDSLPASWRIELALGMVEYLGGTDDEATRYLLRAAELAPEPKHELQYLGDVQMARASAPDPAAAAKLCEYSDRHANDGRMKYYCGAVMFRKDYITNDKSHADEILKRLHASANLLPKDASSYCQLGKAYRWLERWQDALAESRTCAHLDPDSADAHYRLAQIYQHLGQSELSQSEMKLYDVAATRVADENARRAATAKTFLYTIQNETPDRK